MHHKHKNKTKDWIRIVQTKSRSSRQNQNQSDEVIIEAISDKVENQIVQGKTDMPIQEGSQVPKQSRR